MMFIGPAKMESERVEAKGPQGAEECPTSSAA